MESGSRSQKMEGTRSKRSGLCVMVCVELKREKNMRARKGYGIYAANECCFEAGEDGLVCAQGVTKSR